MDWLTVRGLSKLEKENYTVRDINFTQQPSQKIAIAGETGSGKTTLLRMIAGLVQPDAGQIIFENKVFIKKESHFSLHNFILKKLV